MSASAGTKAAPLPLEISRDQLKARYTYERSTAFATCRVTRTVIRQNQVRKAWNTHRRYHQVLAILEPSNPPGKGPAP